MFDRFSGCFFFFVSLFLHVTFYFEADQGAGVRNCNAVGNVECLYYYLLVLSCKVKSLRRFFFFPHPNQGGMISKKCNLSITVTSDSVHRTMFKCIS